MVAYGSYEVDKLTDLVRLYSGANSFGVGWNQPCVTRLLGSLCLPRVASVVASIPRLMRASIVFARLSRRVDVIRLGAHLRASRTLISFWSSSFFVELPAPGGGA